MSFRLSRGILLNAERDVGMYSECKSGSSEFTFDEAMFI